MSFSFSSIVNAQGELGKSLFIEVVMVSAHTDGELSAYLKSTGLLLGHQLENLQIELAHDDVTIGRADSNQVSIAVRTVSDQHVVISYNSQRWFVQDLESQNGTKLNDNRIASMNELGEGDIVSIGGVEFEFGLNKPEILLRQDTIMMHSSPAIDFSQQAYVNDSTVHFSQADLKDLKRGKGYVIKDKIKDLFTFKSIYWVVNVLLFMITIGLLAIEFVL